MSGPTTTRRAAVLALGASCWVLTACSSAELSGPAREPRSTGSADGSGSAAGSGDGSAADPDALALDQALAGTEAALAVVRRAGPTADPGRALLRMHRAHRRTLEAFGAVPEGASPASPTSSGRPSAAKVLRVERALQRDLAEQAEVVPTGAVARLLASLSAGIAAHLGVHGVVTATGPVALTGDESVAAAQAALAAEHAAVFTDGVLGARTSESATPALFALVTASYEAHRTARDTLADLLILAGATPEPAAPTYELPGGGAVPGAVAKAAAAVEARCAETYAYAVAQAPAGGRSWAIAGLTGAARRGAGFGPAAALPGASDLAPAGTGSGGSAG